MHRSQDIICRISSRDYLILAKKPAAIYLGMSPMTEDRNKLEAKSDYRCNKKRTTEVWKTFAGTIIVVFKHNLLLLRVGMVAGPTCE